VDPTSLTKRYLKSAGHAETPATKVPKEVQTQLKVLEVSIRDYTASLIELEDVAVQQADGCVQMAICGSHELVRALEDENAAVLRVLAADTEPVVITAAVAAGLVRVRGRLGWMSREDSISNHNDHMQAASSALPASLPLHTEDTFTPLTVAQAGVSQDLSEFDVIATRLEGLGANLSAQVVASSDKVMRL
jgi:hypothetical protein